MSELNFGYPPLVIIVNISLAESNTKRHNISHKVEVRSIVILFFKLRFQSELAVHSKHLELDGVRFGVFRFDLVGIPGRVHRNCVLC